MVINVLDYGAIGDGITNDAHAIQEAINACTNMGGGRVLLPGGKIYNSGFLHLKSNVDLHIEKGAVLKASDDITDYYPLANEGNIIEHHSGLPSFLNSEYAGRPFHVFITAQSQVGVSLTGAGIIDANEKIFYGTNSGYHIEGSYYPRVPAILLEDIRQLTIKDVTIKECAFWTVHIIGCEDVAIEGVRILNNLQMANSDGIDIDHCNNVRISNCHIECGDDCIVFKNTGDYKKYGECANIVITNCTLISTSAAIKIGTEGEGDFKNILVTNCTISRSNRGISLQIRDDGNAYNIIFSNITIETRRFSNEWWGRAEPICITAIDRKPGVKAGSIKNITFQNIVCSGENGIFIEGSEDNPIENVKFINVTIELLKKSKWAIDGYDVRPCESSGERKTKISGVHCNGAKDILFEHVSICVDNSFLPYYNEDYTLLKTHNVMIKE